MTARNEILNSLKAGGTPAPKIKRRKRRYSNLARQLKVGLEASKGEAYIVDTLEDALAMLGDFLDELGVNTAAVNAESPLMEADLPARFPDRTWYFAHETKDFRKKCANADVGVTGVDLALAETGSLVLTTSETRSRLTSLLPPVHIVLVPRSKIISDIFVWAKQRPSELPSNLVFVSGPSKTGDIEQTLVVGVHGPKRLIVIVYKD